jgi:hypothetical protein
MSSDKILDQIGKIDEDIIDEAENFQPKFKTYVFVSRKKWLFAAAIVCLVIGLILYKQNIFRVFNENNSKGNIVHENNNKENNVAHGNGKDNNTVHENNGNKNNSLHVDNIKYNKVSNPDKIQTTFVSEGAGGGDFGFYFVKDYSEVATKNPTRNNTEGITELPVFKNVEGLWSDPYNDIDSVDKLIYFDHPSYEKTYSYGIFGDPGETYNICFKHDPSKSITDQLLDYSFYQILYVEYRSDVKGGAMVLTPSFGPGTLYPIISLDEAKKKLRSGDFFCYGGEKEVAKTADILSVELIYRTDKYQTYIQPFYLFYITDASWNMKDVMKCDNANEFKSLSPVFIPAVKDEYLKIVDPKVYFN